MDAFSRQNAEIHTNIQDTHTFDDTHSSEKPNNVTDVLRDPEESTVVVKTDPPQDSDMDSGKKEPRVLQDETKYTIKSSMSSSDGESLLYKNNSDDGGNTVKKEFLSGKQIGTMLRKMNNGGTKVSSPIQYEEDEEGYSGSDADSADESELQDMKKQVIFGFQQISKELKKTRIARLDKYLEVITGLKDSLHENYQRNFKNIIQQVTPSIDSSTGLNIYDENSMLSSMVCDKFKYPLPFNSLKQIFLGTSENGANSLRDFPIFTAQFNEILHKYQEAFDTINSKFKYEFEEIECLEKGNIDIIYKQFFENLKQAKKRKLESLENEMCQIEREIYNVKPEYSLGSQFPSRVPEFANFNNKSQYLSKRVEYDGVYTKFKLVPANYSHTKAVELKPVSPAAAAEQDLQLIDLIDSKKRKLENDYDIFLKEVLITHIEKLSNPPTEHKQ